MLALRGFASRPARGPAVVATALALALALAACDRDDPTAPGAHTISGHVKLTGYLVTGGGEFAGTRVVGDADGVAVDLLFGTRVVGTTVTVDGVYTFTGVRPGGYVARAKVFGDVADATEDLTLIDHDLAVADTLRLRSLGDLLLVPNPMAADAIIRFNLPDTQWVAVRVLDLEGGPVRTLVETVRPGGANSTVWNGYTQNGVFVPGSMFWIALETGNDDRRAHLLFR